MKTLNKAAFIHTSVMLRPYLVRRILQFNGVHLQLPNGSRAEGEGMDKNISVGFFSSFFYLHLFIFSKRDEICEKMFEALGAPSSLTLPHPSIQHLSGFTV